MRKQIKSSFRIKNDSLDFRKKKLNSCDLIVYKKGICKMTNMEGNLKDESKSRFNENDKWPLTFQ